MKLVEPNDLVRKLLPRMARLDPDDSEVGDRIKRLRLALGYETCGAFAAAIGVEYNRLNNVENGKPLGKDLAFKLVQAVPGLTTDWLWFDEGSGLPLELAKSLGALGSLDAKGRT